MALGIFELNDTVCINGFAEDKGRIINLNALTNQAEVRFGSGVRLVHVSNLQLVEKSNPFDKFSPSIQESLLDWAKERGWSEDTLREWLKGADTYDVLDKYLTWEGVHGFTGSILNIVRATKA